jgi:hypothetical protein
VSALAWCPQPHIEGGGPPGEAAAAEYEYLLVAAHASEKYHRIRRPFSSNDGDGDGDAGAVGMGSLQLWRVRRVESAPAPSHKATAGAPTGFGGSASAASCAELALTLSHSRGLVRQLEWVPRAVLWEPPERGAGAGVGARERRLGVVAVVFGDGSLEVLAVPDPCALGPGQPAFRSDPLSAPLDDLPRFSCVSPGETIACCAWAPLRGEAGEGEGPAVRLMLAAGLDSGKCDVFDLGCLDRGLAPAPGYHYPGSTLAPKQDATRGAGATSVTSQALMALEAARRASHAWDGKGSGGSGGNGSCGPASVVVPHVLQLPAVDEQWFGEAVVEPSVRCAICATIIMIIPLARRTLAREFNNANLTRLI